MLNFKGVSSKTRHFYNPKYIVQNGQSLHDASRTKHQG